MVELISRFKDIEGHIERDIRKADKYIQELPKESQEMSKAMGRMFEQDHLRFIAMISAAGKSGQQGSIKAT